MYAFYRLGDMQKMVNGESILQGPAAAMLIGRMTRERQTQANGDRIMAMNEWR